MTETASRRALGLDVGEKTLGVALSDPLGYTARGLEVIPRTRLSADIERIRDLVRDWGASVVVVGVPVRMDGTDGTMASRVRGFIARLQASLGVPIVEWDERLTTVQAERELLAGDVRRAERRAVVDRVAAAIILQAYLERERARRAEEEGGVSA